VKKRVPTADNTINATYLRISGAKGTVLLSPFLISPMQPNKEKAKLHLKYFLAFLPF